MKYLIISHILNRAKNKRANINMNIRNFNIRIERNLNINRLVLLWIGLLFILPIIFLSLNQFKIKFSINILVSSIIFIFSIYMLIISIVKKKFAPANMIFWLFNYVWMGFVPLLNILFYEFAWGYEPEQYTIFKSLYILVIGNLGFLMGYKLKIRHKIKNTTNVISKNAFWIFSISIIAVSLLLFLKYPLYYILPIGNNRVEEQNQALLSILNILVKILPYLISSFNIYILRSKKIHEILNKKYYMFFKIYAIILIIYCLLVNNPFVTTRFQFGIVFLSLLSMAKDFSKIKYRIYYAWIFSFGIIFIFSMLSYRFLLTLITKGINQSTIITNIINNKFFAYGDFDAFSMVNVTVDYVKHNGITYGRQLLLPLLFFIPRNIWLNKPVGSGRLVSSSMGLTFNNVSCPLWAEGYLNFGLIGTFLFLFILGYLSKLIDIKISSKNINMINKTLSYYFIFNMFILLRGDLNTGTNSLIVIIVLSIIYKLLSKITI